MKGITDWQAGYDEGRRMGVKTALDERRQLKAELDRLEGSVQSLIQMERNTGNRALEYAGKCDQLKAEIEALRKDAERYRWLRSKHNEPADFLAVCGEDDVILEHLMHVEGLDLDAAVDAAMGQGVKS